ncbi:cell death abnormality protein 1-like isoform X2 [Mercenaria mercenaria]|uniref:cell death abnormality protein 1-like isoform X2 n=1 Tax=Mercenaria mercenaria TaxID=6596 RepID=UPI00234EB595|nr:cell death abnormality protein 1-like isoform X2 [Mercenaria mercenaria]
MSLVFVSILALCLCQTVQTVYPGCENCGCCVDGECSFQKGKTDYCNKGCIDGFYGNRCYINCPCNCAACARNARYINGVKTHECTKCPDGKYSNTSRKCCSLSCPNTCITCISGTVCTECESPYFNYGAVTNCSMLCPTNCESCSESETCLACKDGYHNPASGCRNTCPSSCQSCSSRQNCNRCRTGFYNGRKLDIPTNLFHNNCRYACRSSCEDCSSHNLCSSCVNGKYGNYCENNCSTGCMYGKCDKSTGNCECKNGFTGQQCNECVNGKYGIHCNNECSSVCKNKVCHKSNGQCVECVTNYFTNEYCSSCISGRYGSNCTLKCPNNCSLCERYSGNCSNGCNEQHVGDTRDNYKTEKSSSWNVILSHIGSAFGGMMFASLVGVVLFLRRWIKKKWQRSQQLDTADTVSQRANRSDRSIPLSDLHQYQSLDPSGRENRNVYSTIDDIQNVYENTV